MPSLLLNLDKHSHFPYLLDIEMTVFYRDDFLKILYLDSSVCGWNFKMQSGFSGIIMVDM